MKKLLILLSISVFGLILLSFSSPSKIESEVPYPEGFRKWTHIKTAIIDSQSKAFIRFGGFHHIYANDKAMSGNDSGRFPDGSVFVFDVFEAIYKGGDIVEGKRRMIDVMIKGEEKYKATGGWGFEEFSGDSKTERTVKQTAAVQCFKCHSAMIKNDFVYSSFRD